MVDLLIVGAGPAGCIIAERAANEGRSVLLIDRRPHLAGNCHDSHHASGVLIHRYGPHYFRTNSESLVRYLSAFTEWIPAAYEVRASVGGDLYHFPINLTTLERFFGRELDAESAEHLLASERIPCESPANSEEYVLSRVGRRLFDAFYRGYTRKQWGRDASQLAPSVCGRIPVRLNRDCRYVDAAFQQMPAEGFTELFRRMTANRRIQIELGADYRDLRDVDRRATVWTGPIDEYFGHRFGPLPYRSLAFDFQAHDREYVQPCVQVNYPDESVPFTRAVEIKHVTGQRHEKTVVSVEYPRSSGEPYYPVPDPSSAALYAKYKALADATPSTFFVGRLAEYRYYNTDEVMLRALAAWEGEIRPSLY